MMKDAMRSGVLAGAAVLLAVTLSSCAASSTTGDVDADLRVDTGEGIDGVPDSPFPTATRTAAATFPVKARPMPMPRRMFHPRRMPMSGNADAPTLSCPHARSRKGSPSRSGTNR